MNSRATFACATIIAVSVFAVIRLANAVDAARTADADSPSAVTIHAVEDFGTKIAIREGRESATAPVVGESARRAASADFDSDGVEDLVVVDEAGALRFYKGNSRFLTDPQLEPFAESEYTGETGVAPDFLERGDFNGDGRQDLIAARTGDHEIAFLAGLGDGRFAPPVRVELGGELTVLATGEFGLSDGQTDIVVGEISKKGSQLRIFEHPAGAINHKPEIIAMPEPARFAAIGLIGADGYSDIAIGCESRVVLVQGRGQVAPWDSLRPKEIQRPKALVSARFVAGGVAGIAVGQFDAGRELSVAVLTKDGAIESFSPRNAGKTTNFTKETPPDPTRKPIAFLPSSVDSTPFTASDIRSVRAETSVESTGATQTYAEKRAADEERLRRDAAELAKLPSAERDAFIASIKSKQGANDIKARENFLKTVAAVPVGFTGWEARTIVRDARLAGGRGLTKARVGFSGKDDLLVIDQSAKRISIIAEADDGNGAAAPRLFGFESDAEPVAALPLRLNLDAKSDLIVLRKGASRPTLMMSSPSLTLTVNSDLDNTGSCPDQQGNCTLRSAILTANSNPGSVIVFNLGTASTISPFTELPIIRGNGTVISGLQSNAPSIEIDGTNAGIADGLKIRTSDAVVTGLAINSFNGFDNGNGSMVGGNGITIESTALSPNNGNNWVFGNYLGTDLSGTLDKGNFVGLNLFDTHDNLIGHSNQAFRQVISGNGDRKANEEGLGIIATNSVRGKFYGNIVGLDPEGEIPVPNNMGVLLTGSNNDFGGAGVGEGNTVSGNEAPNLSGFGLCTGEGIMVVTLFAVDANDNPTDRLTFANRIIGSRIGTDRNGMADLGNCREGILTSPDTATSIGSITEQGRNTVSGNGFGGISCIDISAYVPQLTTDFGFCAISGNNVGVDITGTVGIPNDFYGAIGGFSIVTENGINVYHNLNFGVVGLPFGFTMGGSCTGLCNLVNGVIYRNGGYGDVGVFSNYTGVNKTGVISINNYPTNFSPIGGIFASRGNTTVGDFSSIDGVPTSFGNLISGSRCGGLLFGSDIRDNAFGLLSAKANLIGTDAAGLGAVPNGTAGPESCGEGGVRLQNLYGNIEFGGTTPETKNIVSGNIGNGINVGNEGGRLDIINTYIGVNTNGQALGNTEDGIDLFGAGETVIGGTDPNTGNIIRHNGKAGIAALAFQGDTVHHLMIVGNSIHANGELGIDLMRVNGTFPFPNDGVNQNDCLDADDGANSLQNFPELIAPIFNEDGSVTVTGVLRSTPLETFRLDFYSSAAPDSTQYGEGDFHIGSINISTDGNGFASFSAILGGPIPNSQVITSTATNAAGETSEFSCAAGYCTGIATSADELREQLGGLQCSEPLIVNVDTDDADANLDDGVCDTDVSQPNGSQCSLRAAIQHAATMTESAVVANFEIPGAGVHIIRPQSALPTITKRMYLQADTQPGYSGTPLIELRGDLAGDGAIGLQVLAAGNGSRISGFSINRFAGAGIKSDGATIEVDGNFVGLEADGLTMDLDRLQASGIFLNGTLSSKIGLRRLNVVSGNQTGLLIEGAGRNRVVGNRFGTDRNGDALRVNGENRDGSTVAGIVINSSADNEIGLGRGNQISNNWIGMIIAGAASSNNQIKSNLFGTNADGTHIVANGNGIIVRDLAHDNVIGGPTVGSRGNEQNVVSGSLSNGGASGVGMKFETTAGPRNTILGNVVGSDRYLRLDIPNRIGIAILASGTRVGEGRQYDQPRSLILKGNLEIDLAVGSNNEPVSNVEIKNVFSGMSPNGDRFEADLAGIVLSNVRDSIVRESSVTANVGGFSIALISGSSNNRIESNCVGCPMPTGEVPHPNLAGIMITGSSDNQIHKNTIINSRYGIDIEGREVSVSRLYSALGDSIVPNNTPANGNRITGNDIGYVSGQPHRMRAGVFVGPNAHNNIVGGTTDEMANVLVGNVVGLLIGTADASSVAYPTGNTVIGNRIGVQRFTTNDPIPNNFGVVVDKAQNNIIGEESYGNYIAASVYDGIRVKGAVSTGNTITGNTVVGNGGSGVVIEGVGGGTPRNVAPEGNPLAVLRKNNIGVILNGELGTVWSNGGDGVKVLNSINVQIGDLLENFANSLCSAAGNGITIENSAFVRVLGNRIGTDQVGTPNCGNSQNGVFITNGSNNNTVGGPEEGSGNTITGNGGDGVRIDETAGDGNLVDPNSIFGNGGLGIDLNGEGLSVNDPSDADGGANRGQNYPQISNFTIDGNGDLIVEFSVDSSPDNADYGTEGLYVEFFEADGGGEGRHFLGSARYLLSDYNGALAGLKTVNLGNAAALGFQPGDRVSATATDAGGNTSEFSPVLSPTAASVTVAGRVIDAGGNPVRNSKLTLRNITTGEVVTARSNDFGRYRFDGVEVGSTYIVTVSAKGLVFSSNGSLVTVDDSIADLDFIADR